MPRKSISNKLLIIDSTLRDGSHAVRHQFSKDNIRDYCLGAEKAGLELLIVGHGNGLGASSLHLGRALLTDQQTITVAKKNLKKTKLGAFLIPGFGTIRNDLAPAIKQGIQAIMIASHCTEANITKQHIEYSVRNKLDTYGVLMMAHMVSPIELLKQAQLMESYGAQGVLIMDSAGAFLPLEVHQKVTKLVKNLKIPVGFHAHNNYSLAIANSLEAVISGATIIDTTAKGLGAGAGNCSLEVLVAVLKKMNYKLDLDLYTLMDNADQIVSKIMIKPQEITSMELTSAYAGVFSGFVHHAKLIANEFNINVRDLLIELGKNKTIAGQEDQIIKIAAGLKKND